LSLRAIIDAALNAPLRLMPIIQLARTPIIQSAWQHLEGRLQVLRQSVEL
jgi:hypothetical protein